MKKKTYNTFLIVALSGLIISLPVLYIGYSAMWKNGTRIAVYADHIFTAGLFILGISILSFIIWIFAINIKKKDHS